MTFADATVEVVANMSDVDNQMAVGLARAARAAGRAARPIWAAEGRRAGDAYFEAVADQWRGSSGGFVRAGLGAGRSFDRGFKAATRNTFKDLAKGAAAVGSILGKSLLAGGAAIGIQLLAQAAGGLGVVVLGLVATLAPLASTVALLPAAALGAAAAIGTLIIGFHGLGDAISAGLEGDTEKFNEALKKLSPNARAVATAIVGMGAQFKAFQNIVQDRLFAGVAAPFKALATVWLPVATASMGRFADVFNRAFKDVAAVAGTQGFIDNISISLKSASSSASGMFAAIGPLTAAFGTLAAVAAPFIERIGTALGAAGVTLSRFIERTAASGQLADALERAFTVAGQLGAIMFNVGRIFANVFASAGAASGDLLGSLVRITDALADMTSGGALTPIFAGLVSNLGVVLQVVGAFLKALAPVSGVISDSIGRLAGPLVSLFDALGVGLAALAPAFGPFTTFLIAVGSAIEPLLPMAGSLINALVSILAIGLTPMISVLGLVLKLLEPFITTLSAGFAEFAQAVLPVVMDVVTALTTSLIPVFGKIMKALEPFLPAIKDMAAVFAGRLVEALPGLTEAFIKLATALGDIVDQMGENLLTVLTDMAPKIPEIADAFVRWALAVSDMVVAFLPFLPLLLGTGGAGDKMSVMLDTLIFLIDTAAFTAHGWAAVFGIVGESMNVLGDVIGFVGDIITGVWEAVADAIEGFLSFVSAIPGKVGAFLSTLPDVVGGIIDRVIGFFTGLRDRVVAILVTLPERIGTIIGRVLVFFLDLPAKIGTFLATLPGIIGGIIDSVVLWFSELPGKVVAALLVLWTDIQQVFIDGWAWWQKFVQDMVDGVVKFFTELPSRVMRAITGLIDMIADWARNLFGTSKGIVSGGIDDIVKFFTDLPGRISGALGNIAASAWNGLKSFINTGIDLINRMINAANVPLKAAGKDPIPTIGRLAQGIYATRPMVALIAEEGPEVVIPMGPSRRARALALAQQSGLTALLADSGALARIPTQRGTAATTTAAAGPMTTITVNSNAADPETVAMKVTARIARMAANT